MHAKSKTKKALEWVAKDPANRTDAEAARRFGLLSASSITRYRKSAGIDRGGKAINGLLHTIYKISYQCKHCDEIYADQDAAFKCCEEGVRKIVEKGASDETKPVA